MNFQPLIDNLHLILPGLGLLLWAAAQFVSSRARSNPADTWEDRWAPVFLNLSDLGARGIDLMADIKKARGDDSLANGQAKAKELEQKITGWFKAWQAGRKIEVLADAAGWYADLQGKHSRLPLPDPSSGVQMSPSIIPSSRADMDDLDPDKTTKLDDTPAS